MQCETKWITLVREHGQFFMNANFAAEQLNCVVLVVTDCTSSQRFLSSEMTKETIKTKILTGIIYPYSHKLTTFVC